MKIYELAAVFRSKNAGPFRTTFDILFDADEPYRRVKDSGVISKELRAALYGIKPEVVYGVFYVDAARGIKITIPKPIDMISGHPDSRDVHGAQQHIPLKSIEVP